MANEMTVLAFFLAGKISEKDLNKILHPRSWNMERYPSSFLHSSRSLFWKFGINKSDEYTETNLRRILPNFFKSMFVRCPYQRLLSAYRDKFEKEDYSNKLYYQKTYVHSDALRFWWIPCSPIHRLGNYSLDAMASLTANRSPGII